MKHLRHFICLITLLISAPQLKAQALYTVSVSDITYSTYTTDKDSNYKIQYAYLLENYMKTIKHRSIPVYLSFSENSDYGVSYDNLYGYCSVGRYYGLYKKFKKNGIKLIIPLSDHNHDAIKLLDYAFRNLKQLKKIRKAALRQKDFCQTDKKAIQLSDSIVNKLINSEIIR